jgi:hypothetical protein
VSRWHSAVIRTWVQAALALLVASPVAAQSQSKWQLEFAVGGGPSSTPHDISSDLPGAGPPFTTVVGTPSRRIPSWYLGDGALLVNQVNGALGMSQRITPLDPVFQTAFADRQQGAMFGIRVTRAITRRYRLRGAPAPRYSVAFAVDYGRGRFEVNGPAVAAIEAARASFAPALSALIATGPFTAPTVTSTSAIRKSGAQQLFATGALDIDLRTSSGAKSIPYVTVGGGARFRIGEPPEASLDGEYRFQILGANPINEVDKVIIKTSVSDGIVGVIGGGVKYSLSKRWGARFDVRGFIGPERVQTLLNTQSSSAAGSPTGATASLTTPGLQFSNGGGVFSSLSGQNLSDFRAFERHGLQTQVDVTAGLVLRF